MNIRIATNQDRENIQSVYLNAFPEWEREIVSDLAIDLLSDQTMPQTISLVAEIDDTIVGHIAFSPVVIATKEKCQGYLLAPLAVWPDYQKRRIGTDLIE